MGQDLKGWEVRGQELNGSGSGDLPMREVKTERDGRTRHCLTTASSIFVCLALNSLQW